MYRDFYTLVTVSGSESFGVFLESLEKAWHVPLDELELIFYIRNAQARKYKDEQPT